MNHEKRIKQLEEELTQIKKRLSSCGIFDEFVPVAQAAKQLNCSPWVIKNKIKNEKIAQLNKHYKMNGNRYLINVKKWSNLIAADVKAKRR